MADEVQEQPGEGDLPLDQAFGAARALLAQAQADADRLRADADRYVRQRESEAELLVAKARRLLEAAEAQAAAIRSAGGGLLAAAPAVPEPDLVIDLDALAAEGPSAPAATSPGRRPLRPVSGSSPTPVGSADGFDGILATAITRAVDRAFDAGG